MFNIGAPRAGSMFNMPPLWAYMSLCSQSSLQEECDDVYALQPVCMAVYTPSGDTTLSNAAPPPGPSTPQPSTVVFGVISGKLGAHSWYKAPQSIAHVYFRRRIARVRCRASQLDQGCVACFRYNGEGWVRCHYLTRTAYFESLRIAMSGSLVPGSRYYQPPLRVQPQSSQLWPFLPVRAQNRPPTMIHLSILVVTVTGTTNSIAFAQTRAGPEPLQKDDATGHQENATLTASPAVLVLLHSSSCAAAAGALTVQLLVQLRQKQLLQDSCCFAIVLHDRR